MNIAIRSASTSVAHSSSGGFWTWLTGACSNTLPAPDFTLPGVTVPPPLADDVEPGRTRITTLPNGLKIASRKTAVCGVYFCAQFPVSSILSWVADHNYLAFCFLYRDQLVPLEYMLIVVLYMRHLKQQVPASC